MLTCRLVGGYTIENTTMGIITCMQFVVMEDMTSSQAKDGVSQPVSLYPFGFWAVGSRNL